jgi:MFS transporter, PPP family, 3-phenylpropionic acid transporter
MGSDLSRFLALFGSLYLGFGFASPYFPLFLASREVTPQQIGLLLSLSAVVRLAAGPLAGRLADHLRRPRAVLSTVSLAAGTLALSFSFQTHFSILLLTGLIYAAALAPTTSLADALALRSSRKSVTSASFEYGWVRGSGSAAFVLGALLSGQFLGTFGAAFTLMAQAVCLTAAAAAALNVPEIFASQEQRPERAGVSWLLRNRAFLLIILVAALVLSSHAMHDSFAMIAWQTAQITSSVASVLWSEQVVAEVLVFLYAGPRLLQVLSPPGAVAVAATAAALRWAVLGVSSNTLPVACVEPLHGISFALLHLACMRMIVVVTPANLAATAQSIYAAAIGLCSAALTFWSGLLYERLGISAFFVMAIVAGAALPPVWLLARAMAADNLYTGTMSPKASK